MEQQVRSVASYTGVKLALQGNNAYQWRYSLDSFLGIKYPDLRTALEPGGKYVNFDNHPDYTMTEATIKIAHNVDSDSVSVVRSTNCKNRTAYGQNKTGATQVVQASLEAATLAHMETTKDFTDARTQSDLLNVIKAIETEIVLPAAPRMASERYQQLRDLKIEDQPPFVLGDKAIRLHLEYKYYLRLNGLAMDGYQDEEQARLLILSLGPKYAAFKNDAMKRIGITPSTAPVTVIKTVKDLQFWAQQMGIPLDDTKPKETAFRAYPAKQQNPKHSRQNNYHDDDEDCGKCGASDHLRNQCKVDAWCTICAANENTIKYAGGHITEIHRGPRSRTPQRKSSEPRNRGGKQQQQQSKPDRRANYAQRQEEEEDDDEQEETSFFAQASAAQTAVEIAPSHLHEEKVEHIFIARDGNCLYGSIAKASGTSPKFLREAAAEYIEDHIDEPYGAGLTWREILEIENNNAPTDETLQAIRRNQYGGTVEVYALEQYLQQPIAIYKRLVDQQDGVALGFTRLHEPRLLTSDMPAIYLVWSPGRSEAGNHYDLLQLVAPSVGSPQCTQSEDISEPPRPILETPRAITACHFTKGGETAATPLKSLHFDEATDVEASKFHLDSGATAHLLDVGVVTPNPLSKTTEVAGIAGKVTASKASHPVFGKVLVRTTPFGSSLLSLSGLRKTHHLSYYNDTDEFIATRHGKSLTFAQRDGLYTLVDSEVALSAEHRAPTAEELKRFHQAMELHEALHHPSDDVLARSLSSGTFRHQCTSDDLRRARAHFGPCTSCLVGKGTAPPAPPSDAPKPEPGTSLEIDILFVSNAERKSIPFLLAVDVGSAMAGLRQLPNRTAVAIGDSLLQLISDFNLHSKRKVLHVRSDAESGFEAITGLLSTKGVSHRVMPAERHARLAERVIRELKGYMRSTLRGIGFKPPAALYPHLLLDTVMSRNLLSHRRLPFSPREILMGTKPDVQVDFRHKFGTVGHTRVAGLATRDDLSPRTELAVVVGHYIGESGAIRVWLPRSGHIVKRHSITPINLTDAVMREVERGGSLSSDEAFGFYEPTTQPTIDDDPAQPTDEDGDLPPPMDAPPANQQPLNDQPVLTGAQGAATTTPQLPSGTEPLADTEGITITQLEHAPAPQTTRSGRTIRPPERLIQTPMANLAQSSEGNLTMAQAIQLNPTAAFNAVNAELSQMVRLEVFIRRDKRLRSPALPSKMFLKGKPSPTIFKSRIVIGGHLQDKTKMGETYSPTVNTETVNLYLAIASKHSLSPYTLDVSGAFLHVPLEGEPVHMRLSRQVAEMFVKLAPEFKQDVEENGSLIVRINKAIYGLGESSRQWNEHLAKTLSQAGYTQLRFDKSAYVKRKDKSIVSLLCSHVDDLLVVDFDTAWRESLVDHLTRAYGKIKVQSGNELTYLGVNIRKVGHSFRLSQRSLLEALEYRKPTRQHGHPASPDLLEPKKWEPALDPDKFRSTLMRLLYVTSKTRFDLMFATNVLATRQQHCSRHDEEALAQLVDFAKATAQWDFVINPVHLTLTASADASYACHPDGKGHSGVVCSIGGSTIFARSIKQKIVTKSSTEAELIALNLATDEVLYLRNLLDELGLLQDHSSTVIYQDNKSAIMMAQKGELGTKRTKHFTVKHYFVADYIKSGAVRLVHQPGTIIAADGLTKPLTGVLARQWATLLLEGRPSSIDERVRGGMLNGTNRND